MNNRKSVKNCIINIFKVIVMISIPTIPTIMIYIYNTKYLFGGQDNVPALGNFINIIVCPAVFIGLSIVTRLFYKLSTSSVKYKLLSGTFITILGIIIILGLIYLALLLFKTLITS